MTLTTDRPDDSGAPPPAIRSPQLNVVVGAAGGLGRALAQTLLERHPSDLVLALSRSGALPAAPGLHQAAIDLTDEASIAAAAAHARALRDSLAPGSVRRVIVASGLLHHADGLRPEKSMAALDAATLARLFAVNAIGPALVARHFLPLMPRDAPAAFAALSARVGSISDNQLGGWYGYRASKAALNMLIRTLAIEWSRTAKRSVCVGLHPGTVDTGLSRPFQGNVADGRLFTPAYSAACLIDVLDQLAPADSGKVFAWDGSEVPA